MVTLSKSERRVMDLAAEGLTSPEIAKRLRVSKRTVDFHKDNSYKKLGATNIVDALIKGGFLARPESAA